MVRLRVWLHRKIARLRYIRFYRLRYNLGRAWFALLAILVTNRGRFMLAYRGDDWAWAWGELDEWLRMRVKYDAGLSQRDNDMLDEVRAEMVAILGRRGLDFEDAF
jgi:hypothetical protein